MYRFTCFCKIPPQRHVVDLSLLCHCHRSFLALALLHRLNAIERQNQQMSCALHSSPKRICLHANLTLDQRVFLLQHLLFRFFDHSPLSAPLLHGFYFVWRIAFFQAFCPPLLHTGWICSSRLPVFSASLASGLLHKKKEHKQNQGTIPPSGTPAFTACFLLAYVFDFPEASVKM